MQKDRSNTPSLPRGGRRARLPAIALALLLTASSGAAHAELPLLRDSYYEVAPFYQAGGGGFGDSGVHLTGIHIYERNGFFGKVVWTALVATLMALGATDSEYLGSTYGPGYQIDYYRMKSDEELAADAAERDAVVDASAENDYQTDLRLYIPQDGISSARGYSFETYPFSWTVGDTSFDLGLAFSHITLPCPRDIGSGKCRTETFAMPLRVTIELGQIAMLEAQLELNFLGLGSDEQRTKYPHNVRIGATLNATQRMFVRGNLVIPSFDFGDIGLQLEAGVRF